MDSSGNIVVGGNTNSTNLLGSGTFKGILYLISSGGVVTWAKQLNNAISNEVAAVAFNVPGTKIVLSFSKQTYIMVLNAADAAELRHFYHSTTRTVMTKGLLMDSSDNIYIAFESSTKF